MNHACLPRGNRLQRLRQSYFDLLLRAVLSVPHNGFDFYTCNDNPLYAERVRALLSVP
jgi:hypothetical protein